MSNIRQAEANDVDKIVALIYLAIKDIAYQLTGEHAFDAMMAQLKRFYLDKNNRFSASLIRIKVIDEQVVGMILCYDGTLATTLYDPILKHLREDKQLLTATIDKEADEGEYYIDALAVFPEYEGRGIAKELFADAEQYARLQQFKTIALNVDQTNKKALQLYHCLGYVANKQIFINGRPYWHMVKSLM